MGRQYRRHCLQAQELGLEALDDAGISGRGHWRGRKQKGGWREASEVDFHDYPVNLRQVSVTSDDNNNDNEYNMPKIVSRNVVSQSAAESLEKDPNKILTTHYCICGEFSLVLQGPLSTLARRPVDGSYVLRNEGETKRNYKLNVVEGKYKEEEGEGSLVRREETGEFELQRSLHCPRCLLEIAYESTPGINTKGPATFVLKGSVTDVQNMLPEGALGEENVEGL